MGTRGLTRRRLTAAFAAALPSKSAIGAIDDHVWAALVHDLQSANKSWRTAMANLNEAERRYFALPRKKRRGPEPDWYMAAQQAEKEAAGLVENLNFRIARTRAPGREGLALKVRLLAAAYGEDFKADAGDAEDLVSALIRSLLADLDSWRVSGDMETRAR